MGEKIKKAHLEERQLLEHILVVEDDEDVQAYIHSLLKGAFKVSLASNGREALERLKSEPFDLIISDIGMPEMDGFALLRTLRNEWHDVIPFLFLTAHTEKAEVVEALMLGVDAYLTKPFDSDTLLARVRNLLANNHMRKQAYANPDADEEIAEPNSDSQTTLPSFRQLWLKELEHTVKAEIHNPDIKIPDLALKLAISERTLRTRIKQYTGLSPQQYLMEARLDKALQLLENQVYLTVAEVAYAVGLGSGSYFAKLFKERYGKAPSAYL